jgi:hypothetical protein
MSSNNSSILTSCKKLYHQQLMAPFYVLTPPMDIAQKNDYLNFWLDQFFLDLDFKDSNMSWREHPDIHFFQTENDYFLLKELEDLTKLHQYAPRELNYQFAIIESAGKLNQQTSNLLLKSLEEPGNPFVFILKSSEGVEILPTLKSRSIRICEKLPQYSEKKQGTCFFNDLIPYLAENDFQGFYKKYLKLKNNEIDIYLEVLKWQKTISSNSFVLTSKFLNLLQWLMKSKTFNNAPLERAFFLFQYCTAVNKKLTREMNNGK